MRKIALAVLLVLFASYALGFASESSIYDRVMEYTKGLLLNLSSLPVKAKKSFYNGVSRGVKEALNLTRELKLPSEKIEEGLKSIVKTSLLWRLTGREAKLLISGFGRLISLGFSVDGAGEVVKRFIIRDLGGGVFKKVLWLVGVAVRKYGVSASSLESLLREKLSMLDTAGKRKLIKGIIISIREKIREARKK